MRVKVKVILLTLLIASSVCGRCPHQSLFNPCTCEKKGFKSVVRCSHIYDLDVLQKVFDNTLDFRFEAFYLSHSLIPPLNSTWISSKRMGKMGLFNTTLVDLLDRTPNETIPSMRHIKIQNSTLLRRLLWGRFKPFVRLRYLSVSQVEIKRLGKGFQRNVSPELRSLTMTDTATAALEDQVFSGKRRLKHIEIRKGRLKDLKNSYFEDQKTSLQRMDFSYNPIEDLPNDLFQGFEQLKSVTFVGTKIKRLWKPLLDSIKYGVVNFQGNPLECSCLMIWPWIIPKLTSLLLGECKSPAKLKSKKLRDLTEKDFDFCFEEVPEKKLVTTL